MIKIGPITPNTAFKRVVMTLNPPVPVNELYDKWGSVEIPGNTHLGIANPNQKNNTDSFFTGLLFVYHEKTGEFVPIDDPDKITEQNIEEGNSMGQWLVFREDVVQAYFKHEAPDLAVAVMYYTYTPAAPQVGYSAPISPIEIGDDQSVRVTGTTPPTSVEGYPMYGVPRYPWNPHPVRNLPVAPYQQSASFMPLSGCAPCNMYGAVGGYNTVPMGYYGYGLGNAPAVTKEQAPGYWLSWQMFFDGVGATAAVAGGVILGITGVAWLPVTLIVGSIAYGIYRLATNTTVQVLVNDVGAGFTSGWNKQNLKPNASVPQTIAHMVARTSRAIQDGVQAGINGMDAALKKIDSALKWMQKYGKYLLIGMGVFAVLGLGTALYIRTRTTASRRR